MGRAYVIKGVAYPSVTTILGVLDKGNALIQWGVNCAIEYMSQQLNEDEEHRIDDRQISEILNSARYEWRNVKTDAADIGTTAHNLIERYIKYGDMPDSNVNEKAKTAFEAFREWEREHNVEFIESELTVISKSHGYAGTLDLLCKLDGKETVVDFKTSKDFYAGYGKQIAAYKFACVEMKLCGSDANIGVLRIDKETGMPEYKDYSKDFLRKLDSFVKLTAFYYADKVRRLKNNPFVRR